MNWRSTLYDTYSGDIYAMIEDLDDDELFDALEELGRKELRQEARARGLPSPVEFD